MAKKLNTRKLTKDWLAVQGYKYFPTEFQAPGMKFTKDLAGFVDCIGVKPGHSIAYIQYTSWSHFGDRRDKILHDCADDARLFVGARSTQVLVMGWRETDPNKDNLKIGRITIDRKTGALQCVESKLRA